MSPAAVVRLLGVALVLALTAAWLGTGEPEPAAAPPTADLELTAQGALRVLNSRSGESIFRAADLRPGRGVAGSLTLTNRSRFRVSMMLSKRRLDNVPGPYGGRLSSRLHLSIEEVSHTPLKRAYRGRLTAMRPLRLRPLAPGERRRYRFIVRFPDGGHPASNATGDNRFQGARLSVDYRWRAVAQATR